MKLHPIFAACCTDHHPDDLGKPFVIGERVYATDAVICVRAPRGDRTAVEGQRVPPADKLEWTRPNVAAVELPEVGDGNKACETCGWVGKIGDWECEDCDGAGFYGDPTGVRVGPILLAKRYIALLQRNDVSSIFPTVLPPASKRREPGPAAYFIGDGFEGLLMGVAEDAPALRGYRLSKTGGAA